MAKIRVYELARDLNMKSKVLLEKLKDMDITVGSHVSSLDDDVVTRVRADVFGAKSDSSDVKRLKSTVIRRRKKRVLGKPGQPEPIESKEHPPVDISAKDNTEPPGQDQMPDMKNIEQPSDKSEKSPQELLVEDKIKEPVEDKAKITEAPAPDYDQKKAGTQKNAKESLSVAGETSPDVTDKHNDADSKKAGQSAVKPVKPVRPSQERPSVSKDEKPAQALKNEKRSRKRKKRKKETPAKIIKLPTEQEKASAPKEVIKKKGLAEKSSRGRRQTTASAPYGAKTPPTDRTVQKDSPLRDKKKKNQRKKSDADMTRRVVSQDKPSSGKEIKWTKKKISFKRKEVVEGAALYDRSQRGKKGRRGAAKAKNVKAQKPQITTPKAIKRRVKIDDTIVLSDLAKRMGIKANEMIQKLIGLGVMVTVNQTIDFDTAVLVASEFDYELERASFEEESILSETTEKDDPAKLTERSPVVTIMGHVDHGKTSLLDVIRKTRITEIEAGGITQHIGAYNVSTDNGQITFLDTPGHEAFTSMRARGAKVTDLVVLVVAADDGVMPQTVEAINHSKAAGVPIIVAVNKIDKANADTDRVVRELSEQGLVPEDWGGDTIFVKVSAKQNQGIDNLLEMILLQSEVLELKANADKLAKGYVVESKLDSGRGSVATVLVQEGTLHAGNSVVCGIHHGKIRAMLNDRGVQVESAGPSIPVEVIGLSGVPNAGDELIAVSDDKSAKQVSVHRVQKQRAKELAKTSRMSLEKLFEKMKEGEVKELNLIIKADVHGSIEAITDSLVKLSNEEVTIHVVHSATGTITESDVSLAAVSDAIIIGFNVRPTPKVQAFASEEHVDMRFYNVIYNAIKDIQDAIVGMMASTYEERVLGRAEVRQVFHVPKVGSVAGTYVTDGKISRGKLVRLLRDGVVFFEGKLASLRRFKDDVKEVQSGYECGIGIEDYNDIKVGDIIECYYLEEIKPEIS
ncbi:translation initiation factor IF-2 [Desulfonema magnum]|uniref:Translation initiation factor IF-2 n=1 Tax=Desulfonema magnum TaxID=45655 RepID=A0A975GV79_9BACT|nr:translation initiation factor IF-2 [Desulfonema magnum]QTA93388.1 Putative translation initiation factor IF-2 [Desulfonema magnum]